MISSYGRNQVVMVMKYTGTLKYSLSVHTASEGSLLLAGSGWADTDEN